MGRGFSSAVVAVLGMAVSLAAFAVTRQWEADRVRHELEHHAATYGKVLAHFPHMYIEDLRSIRSLFAASGAVDRAAFRIFAGDILRRHPGIQALAWAPRVAAAQRPAFEEAARRDGVPGFHFAGAGDAGEPAPAGPRERYFPVYYLEPAEGNDGLLGLDLGADPARLEALERARDTGRPVVAGHLGAGGEPGDGARFRVLFLPVYRNGLPAQTTAQRRDALAGFVLGVFHIGAMIEAASRHLSISGKFDVLLFDDDATPDKRLLHRHPAHAAAPGRGTGAGGAAGESIELAAPLRVADRRWTAVFRPTPALVAKLHGHPFPLLVLLAGLVLSVTLSAYLLHQHRQARAVERSVEQRTRDLRRVNRRISVLMNVAVDPVITIDCEGTIRSFNPAAERTFGYSVMEAVGRNVSMLMPEPYRSAHDTYLGNYRRTGKARIIGRTRQFVGQRKDGSTFPLELAVANAAVQEDGDQFFVGVVRDITERKQAEQEMHRQSTVLDLMYRVAAIANEADAPEDAMSTSVHYICVAMDWQVGHIYVPAETSPDVLVSSGLWYLEDAERFAAFRRATEQTATERGAGLPGRAFAGGEPLWVEDATADFDALRERPARDAGLRTAIVVPVTVGAEVTAVLEFLSERPLRTDESLVQVLVNLGTQLGRVFERKRAETALTAKERALHERVTELRDTQRALEQKSRELAAHRDHLEEKVAERTAEVQRQAEQLAQALAKEQELNTLQREFVSLVSHEFRTPLTIIDGAAQRLVRRQEELTPEDLVSRTDKIRAAVKRMTELIESTLYASRLDAGAIRMDRQPCNPKALIREVCARQAEISPAHDIRVEVDALPDQIHADRSLLDQVFTNLLSNAVKYAPNDPRIEVEGRSDGDFVTVSVRDHGVGIPAEDLPRLCERFFRASTSAGISGTGIGLNLVKQLVEMHQGAIHVDSVEGEGSVFTVRLPVDLRAAGAEEPGDEPGPWPVPVRSVLAG